MTSLHVICGLGPPNQNSWLRLCPLVDNINIIVVVDIIIINIIIVDNINIINIMPSGRQEKYIRIVVTKNM